MIGTILQPTFLPWIGYFELINTAEIFVIYDHVQFVKKSWQQRNRIKTANGVVTLTIPVKHETQKIRICDVKLAPNSNIQLEKHWKTIFLAYQKAPFFKKYEHIFENIFSKNHIFLRDLNLEIIKNVCDILKIKKQFILSSELNLDESNLDRTEKVIQLCKHVGISHLYDAKGADAILDQSMFMKHNVKIKFQNFKHPTYNQLWGDFIPQMSIIDLLFNEGENCINIIKKGKVV